MIKRLTLFLLIALTAFGASTAQSTGTWNIMPVYGTAAEQMIDTPDLVYYLSSGHLYSYNKDTDETRHYTTVNALNDVGVSMIAYNPYSRYLAVVYSSFNIDLLYDNGRVVNLPDVRDANISADKTINAIDFTPEGRMYVATNFGFVAFDDKKHRVADSGVYNTPFGYAGEVNGHIVLSKNNNIYASPVEARHNSFDSFTGMGTLPGTGAVFHHLGTDRLVARNTLTTSSNQYFVLTPDFANATVEMSRIDNGQLRMDFCDAADGSVYLIAGTVIRNIKPDGSVTTVNVLPQVLQSKKLAMRSGPASIWVSDASGISEYSVADNGDLTQLREPSRPDALTCSWPAYLKLSPDGNRIYVSNIGYDDTHSNVSSNDKGFKVEQTTNIIENGELRDVTCYDMDNTGQTMIGGTFAPVEDPQDPSSYYISNFQKGIYKIKDGEQVGHILPAQMPFSAGWAQWVEEIKFDRKGNMWIAVWWFSDQNPLYVLPAEKLKNLESITRSDWLTPALEPYRHSAGVVSVHHSRSNYIVCSCNLEQRGFLVYDHKGTETNLSDDTYYVFNSFVDQDGAEQTLKNVQCMMEDSSGRIWVGMSGGVFVINDITTAIRNNSLHVRFPKVARNDGTNYADYLLNGETVMNICEDPAGRKWIATENSGVYLVNADGTEIIENFTHENSSLPSNKVLSVMADPHSNTVYFGTDKGLVSYGSTATQGAEDYSDVYAYPNPVRPDYTGWITITGLMDNSLVKITDTAGNLVHQGTSEGGMYLWDGCNTANQRVRSGVYFVFASQNATGTASGKPVTKIMVIN